MNQNDMFERGLEAGLRIGLEYGRREREFEDRQGRLEKNVIKDVARNQRWFLIRLAIDTRVEKQTGRTKVRRLPDIEAALDDNVEAIARAWKLADDDPRKKTFVKALTKTTKDTHEAAQSYMNARLDGRSPEDATADVEAWSRFDRV